MIGLLPAENWEYKITDIFHGLTSILGSSKQNRMIEIAGVGSCIPIRSGRSGIVTAIKALNLPPGSRIGVPLYSCPVVFKAIKASGCKACFIDIEPDTFCLSIKDLSAKLLKLDALIAIHMFGNMCDMPSVEIVAKGIPIIEDCAQSLGSKLNNRVAGSFGTISVFSFRSGKYLSVGEGGALYSNDSVIRNRMTKLIAAMPAPGRAEECLHIAKTYIRSKLRSKPLFGPVGHPLWNIYNNNVPYTTKSPIVYGQIYSSDFAIACHRFTFMDSAIKKQRTHAVFFSLTLKINSNMLCSEKAGAFYNRYLYPITFPSSKQRNMMANYLHNHQISTIKPYQDIAEIAALHYGYAGDCPVTERISKRVLAIPIHYNLKKRDIYRIAQCLNIGWEKINNCNSIDIL